MTAGLPRSRTSASARTPPARISEVLETVSVECFGFRGSYDSNSQLRFRAHERRSTGYGGTGNQRGAVRSQSMLIDDADGACADGSAGAQALHVLRQPALRGRPGALSSAHGLLRHAGRGRGVAERRARDLPGCLGRRSPGPQAARASRGGGRRSGPACRRTSAAGRPGACARPRSGARCAEPGRRSRARCTRCAARCAARRRTAGRGCAGCQVGCAPDRRATDHRAGARA